MGSAIKGKVVSAIVGVVVGIASLAFAAAPAQAAGTSSYCAPGIGCGSVKVYSVSNGITFHYDLSINDTNCSAASNRAYVDVRVWYTSGISRYSSTAIADNNCADGRAATRTNLVYANEGNAVPGTLVYFKVVVYDSQHVNGVLGPRVNF
jgi:hypothetical protein